MHYNDLVAWANGLVKMYFVSEGEMRPIEFSEYQLMPLGDLPQGSRITPDYRLAYIISEHQKRQLQALS